MAQWAQVEVDLSKLLGPINDVIAKIDSVLAFLIAVLNIVNKILEVVKVFLVGLLDPIRAIVEAIIEEIRNIIQDLKQLGVYITGDWKLFDADKNFVDLVGGYQGYERRMVARLLDTSDPGRPDFSSSSAVVGAFFYASSGDVAKLIRLVQTLVRFFGQGDLMGSANPAATPPTPTVLYGSESDFVTRYDSLSAAIAEGVLPDAVSLTWGMPSGVGGKGLFGPVPKGFLVHVSTVPDGLELVTIQPNTENSNDPKNPNVLVSAGVDPLTNGSLKLYGGVADLKSGSEDFSDLEFVDPQRGNLFLKLGQNTPLIRPSTLVENGKLLVGNTFFVKAPLVLRGGAGTKFTAKIPFNLLPKGASFEKGSDGFAAAKVIETPDTYYFRVRAVAKDLSEELQASPGGNLRSPKSVYGSGWSLYKITNDDLLINKKTTLLPATMGNGSPDFKEVSKSSGPAIATQLTEVGAGFQNAVKTAVLLGILARADLSPAKTVDGEEVFEKNTYPAGGELGIEEGVREFMGRYGITQTFFNGSNSQRFRKRCNRLMARIQADLVRNSTIPNILMESLLKNEDVQALLEFKVQYGAGLDAVEKTILSLIEDKSPLKGLGQNPFARGTTMSRGQIRALFQSDYGNGPARSPGFAERGESDGIIVEDGPWNPGDGSADQSPVLFDDTSGTVEFFRNAVLDSEDGEAALEGAKLILQVAAARKTLNDTNWITVRVLPQGVPQLEQALDKVEAFLQKILDALQGAIDFIIAIIDAIQARIFQLQALLELIRAILRSLQLFTIGPFAGLVFVESGTAGLVTGLMTAENKPQDSAASYGAGVAVVAGGLPSVLLETIALLLGAGGDE